jgi:hypothetical protein
MDKRAAALSDAGIRVCLAVARKNIFQFTGEPEAGCQYVQLKKTIQGCSCGFDREVEMQPGHSPGELNPRPGPGLHAQQIPARVEIWMQQSLTCSDGYLWLLLLSSATMHSAFWLYRPPDSKDRLQNLP